MLPAVVGLLVFSVIAVSFGIISAHGSAARNARTRTAAPPQEKRESVPPRGNNGENPEAMKLAAAGVTQSSQGNAQ